jgi:hypothetical protein
MRLEPKIIQRTKDAQQRVFRLAERDYGLTRKAISLDAGIDYDSVCNYAKGETQMPVAVLFALIGVVPDELLSLLLPEGRSIVRVPEGIDHDAIADWAEKYQRTKLAAHREDSPMGPQIAPCEDDTLRGIVVAFPAAAVA